ncbi:conserved hypothetical protein [Ricinus communis]|uniref:Uncharacterized protein n=1 Tax=Ricinus communis TaxID=3988 RepID=B9SSB5_RICCO|nr:conserved hypothetical protein [Ricinus communis]
MERYAWIDRIRDWGLYSSAAADNCDTYALCGAQGSCDIDNSPVCSCLNKFVPRHENDWNKADWSGGCVRRTPLDCEGDGFIRYPNVKLPDMMNISINASMTLEECKKMCSENCSCMAYANSDIRGSGSGCFLWFGNLIDIKQDKKDGQDLYIKMASSELVVENHVSSNRKKQLEVIASSVSLIGLLFLVLGLVLFIRTKKQHKQGKQENLELPHFDFNIIANATNNFSFNNMLGEGGFGPVYNGLLRGQEVAVKRLSKDSRQGLDEFKNEVKYIAKLQHRNLIILTDEIRSKQLDWTDSRLRNIHRDIKLSNISLDNEMNPKISDFGLARSFGGNETEANTKRFTISCNGYMSPEYAIDGVFSVKSDVISSGVLVLEIISGRRNRGFKHPYYHLNLPGHGGFGLVFKGILKDGQELAVKRLSKNSNQRVDDFMNEVVHIAKHQDRNVVKLLGCCIKTEEKMLIYEFMPNKSLDFFIFDQTRSSMLDWPKAVPHNQWDCTWTSLSSPRFKAKNSS